MGMDPRLLRPKRRRATGPKPPSITVPGAQTVAGNTAETSPKNDILFNSSFGNAIAVSGDGQITLTLSAANGHLWGFPPHTQNTTSYSWNPGDNHALEVRSAAANTERIAFGVYLLSGWWVYVSFAADADATEIAAACAGKIPLVSPPGVTIDGSQRVWTLEVDGGAVSDVGPYFEHSSIALDMSADGKTIEAVGTAMQLTAYLGELRYQPEDDFAGSDSLEIDAENSAGTDEASVEIFVGDPAFDEAIADWSAATGARTPANTDFAAEFAEAGTDYLSSSSAAIRTDPTNGLTVCFWLYYTSGTFPCACEGGDGGWRFDFAAGGGRFLVWDSGGGLIGNIQFGDGSPIVGSWMFFALQIDPGMSKGRIRRNREPWVEDDLSGAPAAGTAATIIGALSGGSGFVGKFGSLLIAQQVLSESEIDEVYGTPGGATYAGLSAGLKTKTAEFWDFAEASGNRVGAKASIALVPTGTVARDAGPATAVPTVTGDPVAFLIGAGEGDTRIDLMAVGAARPTFVAAADNRTGRAAIRFPNSTTVRLNAPGSYPLRNLTIAVVGSRHHNDGIFDKVVIGSEGSGVYGKVQDFAQKPGLNFAGMTGDPAGAAFYRTLDADVRVAATDGDGAIIWQNDASNDTYSAPSDATASGIAVGGADYGTHEDIERVIVWDRRLTDDEIEAVRAHLRVQYPRPSLSTSLPVVMFTGNSIHYGSGTSEVGNDIASLAMAEVGFAYGSRWLNFSIPGQRTTECTADDPGRLTPHRSDARRTVVCWTEITNDIYLYGQNAAQAEANLTAYVAAIFAALPSNSRIVLTSCLPRGGDYTVRNAVNAWLLTKFTVASGSSNVLLPDPLATEFENCVLADWASVTNMGADGDEEDETYYDGLHIHPNDTGAPLLAAVTADAIAVALA
jgi:hypothetical protein